MSLTKKCYVKNHLSARQRRGNHLHRRTSAEPSTKRRHSVSEVSLWAAQRQVKA